MGDHVKPGGTMFAPKETPFDHNLIAAKACNYAKSLGGSHEKHLLAEEAYKRGAYQQYELERQREKQNVSV